jgi:ABC-type tungstate transport system permease subunit
MMLAVRDLENLGPIQKQMLQYKDLMTFLNKHVNSKSAEIINGYIVNTSSLYLAHFRGFASLSRFPCS